MLKHEIEALRTHESLSRLYREKPDMFKAVTDKMISRAINKSSKLKQMQQYLTKNVLLTKEERELISSIEELRNVFNGGKNV